MPNATENDNRQTLLETARDFGAREAYRWFPRWSDDLERRIMADYQAAFERNDWLEVRDAVKQGWDEMHEIIAPGEPVVHQY